MPILDLNLRLETGSCWVPAIVAQSQLWLQVIFLPAEIKKNLPPDCQSRIFMIDWNDEPFCQVNDVLAIAPSEWRQAINNEMARLKAEVDKL
jgi:hypothetical protein